MKKKSGIAIFMLIALVISSMPVIAEAEDYVSPAENDILEESVADELSVQESIRLQAEELDELKAGVDYVENEAVFSANSMEEAEEVAESYGAELSSWRDGVAVIEFKDDLKDSLEAASERPDIDREVFPNYLFEIADYLYPGELLESESAEDWEEGSKAQSVSPNDKKYSEQWHHKKINSETAWTVTSGNSASVAVIDNGFYKDHEDIKNNVVESYSVSDGSTDVSPIENEKTRSHGTHVAGIIAAEANNGVGGCGVAPEASLYLIKVSESDGTMPVSNVVRALNKAASWNVDVINVSLGKSSFSLDNVKLLQEAVDAVNASGATLICACGNEGVENEFYPAACEGAFSVAAINKEGGLASYSNFGDWVDIAAPGSKIYSCYINNLYGEMDGTSMASPVVAGIAAIIYANNPELSAMNNENAPAAVKAKLLESSDGVTYYSSATKGSVTGCVDAAKAVESEAQVPEKKESPFYVKINSGFVTDGGTFWITKGKALSLTVVDSNGKKIREAAKKNATVYTSSNTDLFKLKNNKLKCSADISAYAAGSVYSKIPRTVVTVNYKDSSVRIKFVALEKIKKMGFYNEPDRKVLKLTVSQGNSISLNKISDLSEEDIGYFGKKNMKIGTIRAVGYILSIPKKAESMVSYDSKGKPVSFTASKKGTYRFKLTAPGGVKKKFTLQIKVS